jgi:hypothetical protein
MAGMAKMFAGDIIETGERWRVRINAHTEERAALDIRDERGSDADSRAPLKPGQLRAALMRMQSQGRSFPLPGSERANPFL